MDTENTLISGGVYLLKIQIYTDLKVIFGRYQNGAEIFLSAGLYSYTGSALTSSHNPALARRLVRHCTRTQQQPPHELRESLLDFFNHPGISTKVIQPPRDKKLHWHIDYLLDMSSVSITNIVLFPENHAIEDRIGKWLEEQPETFIPAKGVGAKDTPGNTHLSGIRPATDANWQFLLERLFQFQSSLCSGCSPILIQD